MALYNDNIIDKIKLYCKCDKNYRHIFVSPCDNKILVLSIRILVYDIKADPKNITTNNGED